MRDREHPRRELRRTVWVEPRQHFEQMGEDVLKLIFDVAALTQSTHQSADRSTDFAQERLARLGIASLSPLEKFR